MTDLPHVIDQMFALTDALKWEERAELCTTDVDFLTPQGQTTGRQATIDFSIPFGTAFPTMQHTLDRVVVSASGDEAAVEGRWIATNSGPLTTPQGIVPPTGRTVEFGWSGMFHWDGQHLDRIHIYFDQMSMLGQLGLLPEPAEANAQV
jgi:predicted ester cyclase